MDVFVISLGSVPGVYGNSVKAVVIMHLPNFTNNY